MSDEAEIAGLIDQLEAATDAQFVLDSAIALAVIPGAVASENGVVLVPSPNLDASSYSVMPRPYTASVDAALTLAEGFVLLHLSDIGADGLPYAVLGDPSATPSREWSGIGATLALALCIAALKSRHLLDHPNAE